MTALASDLRNADDDELIAKYINDDNPVIVELVRRLEASHEHEAGLIAELIAGNDRLHRKIEHYRDANKQLIEQRDTYYNRMIELEQETQS